MHLYRYFPDVEQFIACFQRENREKHRYLEMFTAKGADLRHIKDAEQCASSLAS